MTVAVLQSTRSPIVTWKIDLLSICVVRQLDLAPHVERMGAIGTVNALRAIRDNNVSHAKLGNPLYYVILCLEHLSFQPTLAS